MSGIVPVREHRIIRPLIEARRAQIEEYVKAAGILCVTDASNEDTRFVRNRIRSDLLPLLASAYNPQIVPQLNRLADVMRAEETWITGIVRKQYQQFVKQSGQESVSLSLQRLKDSPPALSRRIIRMAIEELTGNSRKIGFVHIQSVQRLVDGNGGQKELHLPGGLRTRRSNDRLVLARGPRRRGPRVAAMPEQTVSPKKILSGPFPKTVTVEEMGLGLHITPCPRQRMPAWSQLGPERVYLDADRLNLPLTIRRAAPGDRFCPLGAGGRQKLKKFFIDHRISRKDRERTPVVADTRGIIWLVGQRIDERVKITARTSRILSIEFFLLDTR